MIETGVVRDLIDHLLNGDKEQQAAAAIHIRDLCAEKEEYRPAFASAVTPLLGLLESGLPPKPATLTLTQTATQALGLLSECDTNRDSIRAAGGIENLVSLLKALNAATASDAARSLRSILLSVLLALAVDEPNRVVAYSAGVVPVLVQLLGTKGDPATVEQAAKLIGRLAYNRTIKDSVRDAHGITALLKLLQPGQGARLDTRLAETVAVSLTVLAVNNELNQDAIRDGYGIAPIVKILEGPKEAAVTSAAADLVRAVALNNDANKNAVREAWALPQLVKLLGSEVDLVLVGKAVDCLRILTTGNEPNKAALFGIPSALSSLVRLMDSRQPSVIIERSAAVVGNLSSNQDFFVAIREAGTMQRLVALLEAGPHSRVTEIAAKTLANLAVDESNQTAIRLSGGIPPLMRLLTLKPTDQVLSAAEGALRRLQVSGAERNAILDTLRYVDALAAQRTAVSEAEARGREAADADAQARQSAAAASTAETSESKPFTRYTVEETVELLSSIGFRETDSIASCGLNGGDILELTDQEMHNELKLSHLQAKKLRNVQAAFKLFNSMMRRPGKGDLTFLELQDWLVRRGRSEADVACIRDGLKDALGKGTLAVLGFRDFVRMFSWFTSTLNMMATQEQDSAVDMARLASISSLHSEASGVKVERPNDKERPIDNGSSVNEPHENGNAEDNRDVSPDVSLNAPKEA